MFENKIIAISIAFNEQTIYFLNFAPNLAMLLLFVVLVDLDVPDGLESLDLPAQVRAGQMEDRSQDPRYSKTTVLKI